MHVLPDLKKLEAKYARELVVIGVHSAKFTNEKQTDNIRDAIKRYEIEHPVINDKDFVTWRLYGARSWPTLVLINPSGRVIGAHSGEGVYDIFDSVILQTIAHFDAKKELDRRPLSFALERVRSPRSVFAYPGKIVADEKGGRIFFSDSNNNRLIVATPDGHLLDAIGGVEAGLKDGDYGTARFFRPQGLAHDPAEDSLYVADTENHALRKVDLKRQTVSTIAGTGRQARRPNEEGSAKLTSLNSPWDLVLARDSLFIAMAGSHQLWRLDWKTQQLQVHAGTARENLADGPLREAALAQPSGLATDGLKLFFADSEVSAVRVADLSPTGRVDTLVGKGLFEFGDVDGPGAIARLQHCLGVAWHSGMLYVADTYNHKIRRIDPRTREVTTFAGTGRPGWRDDDRLRAQFNEPSGLCFYKDRLLIADANNHLIRSCELQSGRISTVVFKGFERLERAATNVPASDRLVMKALKVAPGATALKLSLELPAGTKLNPVAPSRFKAAAANAQTLALRIPAGELKDRRTDLLCRLTLGQTTMNLDLDIYYCTESNAGLCYFKSARFVVPIEVAAGGALEPVLPVRLD
jgi:sugar lactone lactonase YvrE